MFYSIGGSYLHVVFIILVFTNNDDCETLFLTNNDRWGDISIMKSMHDYIWLRSFTTEN